MRALALALVVIVLTPAVAAGSRRDAPVRVLWNSRPGDASVWDARLSLLQGPGGFVAPHVRPVLLVIRMPGGTARRVPMAPDIGPNTFRATVEFRGPGRYAIAVTRFDPRHPARRARLPRSAFMAAPEPPAHDGGGALWLWAVVGAALAGMVVAIRRTRARPA